MWLDLISGSEMNTTTKYTLSLREGLNTIIVQNGTLVPSIILDITIHNLSSADGGNYTCRGVRGESVTQLTIVEGTASPTAPPPPTTPHLTTRSTQPTLAPNNQLPPVHILVSVVIILVIALLLFIVFIVCLLKKIKKKKSLLTEAVKVPNLLSVKEKCSISVQDVIYEEIAERNDMSLTKNKAYVCVSTLRQPKSY